VYELADTLTQLWFHAERRWCGAKQGDELPGRVDALIGQILHLTENLARQPAIDAARAEAIGLAVSAAWEQYRSAWQGWRHLETLAQLQNVDPEFRDEAERRALSRSPLAGPGWAELKNATVTLQEALPPVLCTCFQVSSLLAAELYPTDERDQRVEQMDVTERRYLTVTLNRELGRLKGALAQAFPELRGLDWELSGETEMRAMEKISQLHQGMRRLKVPPIMDGQQASPTGPVRAGGTDCDSTAQEGGAGRGPVVFDAAAVMAEKTTQQGTSAKSDGTAEKLSFVPGGFRYRGQQHDLSGKALQVLEALYRAPGQAMTLHDLQNTIWPDQEAGQETIRSAVKVARRALREAMRAANVPGPNDPVPAVDRGTGRTAWRLDLP
jgi:hypothetical protein